MKVKNIMFSGVMAAILMSVAGAANAADPISVASTGYVDTKVGAVDTKVGSIPQGGFTVGSDNYNDVATAITALDTKTKGLVGSEEVGKIQESVATLTGDATKEGSVKYQIKAVEDAQKLVDAEQDGKIQANADAITTLNAGAETVGSVANKIAQAVSDEALSKYTTDTELEDKGYQTADDVQTAISDLKLGETYATVSALNGVKATAEAAQTAEQVGSAIDTKISDLKLGEIYQTKLDEAQMAAVDSGVTADKVSGYDTAVSAVNNAKSGLGATNAIAVANKTAIEATDTGLAAAHSAIAKLNAGASEEGSVENTVQGYAVPKPGTNCQKTTCVLTVDKDTNEPYWMELALPTTAAE